MQCDYIFQQIHDFHCIRPNLCYIHLLLWASLLLNISPSLLKQVLKIVSIFAEADLSSDLEMVHCLADLIRTQAQGKLGDCLLQLFHRRGGIPPELCLAHAPEPVVERREIRAAGGPGRPVQHIRERPP